MSIEQTTVRFAWLPRGAELSAVEFQRRHRLLNLFLAAHLPAILAVSLTTGTFGAALLGAMVFTAVLVTVADRFGNAMAKAQASSMGLVMACSALLYVSHGSTHVHIWFYVVMVAISMYQMWTPFVMAAAFVAVHHVGMTLIHPHAVFSDPLAMQHPLPYALLHAGFLLAEAGWLAGHWSLAERVERERVASLREADALRLAQTQAAAELNDERARAAETETQRLRDREARALTLASELQAMQGNGKALASSVADAEAIIDRLYEAGRTINTQANEVSRITDSASSQSVSVNAAMEKLQDTLNEVDTLAGAIESVAKQTNLLALNATIEATRAGSAGAGFAVVAGEVKVLATQTTAATERIRRVVDAVHADVRVASAAIQGIHSTISDVAGAQTQILHATEFQEQDTTRGRATIAEISRAADSFQQRLGAVANEA